MHLGILDQSVHGWAAGKTFTQSMLLALGKAAGYHPDVQITFLKKEAEQPLQANFAVEKIPNNLDGKASQRICRQLALDVVLPIRDFSFSPSVCASVGWIPDFQHEFLRDFTNKDHLKFMRSLLRHLAEKCTLVLLSSENARSQFDDLYPEFRKKARVAKFTSSLWSENLSPNPLVTVSKYNLPPRYGLVANQFWGHKNHRILPVALQTLNKSGQKIHLVLTGVPADFRDPENSALSEFFQSCHQLGIVDQIHFLGKIPYPEMVDLMRAAEFVLQPSLWEGWSTSIEDAKALGKPLICSNLMVHKEQMPEAVGFFDPQDAQGLAEIMKKVLSRSVTGWIKLAEGESIERYASNASIFGGKLIEMAEEACLSKKNSEVMNKRFFSWN